jgi:hypothetical protein
VRILVTGGAGFNNFSTGHRSHAASVRGLVEQVLAET